MNEKEDLIKSLHKLYTRVQFVTIFGCLIISIFAALWLFHSTSKEFGAGLLDVYLFFFFFYTISARHYFKTLKEKPEIVARYYMINLLARFLLCGAIAVIYVMAIHIETKAFLLCFLGLFIMTLISESLVFVHIEKKLNEKRIEH